MATLPGKTPQPSTPIGPVPVVIPPWIPVALGELGVLEDIRPGRSTARIEEYHAVTGAGVAPDDVPWCASFACWSLEQCGIKSTRSKTARAFATWGAPCVRTSKVAPTRWRWTVGAVVVFGPRDADAGGSGHVGFLLGASGPDVWILGGNQQNRVSIAQRKAADVLAVRWPESVPIPTSIRPPPPAK